MKKTYIIILSIISIVLLITSCNLDANKGIIASIVESQPITEIKIMSAIGYKSNIAYFLATDGIYSQAKDGSAVKVIGNTSEMIIREAILSSSEDRIFFVAQNENTNVTEFYSITIGGEDLQNLNDSNVVKLASEIIIRKVSDTEYSFSLPGLPQFYSITDVNSSTISFLGDYDYVSNKHSVLVTWTDTSNVKKACIVRSNTSAMPLTLADNYNSFIGYSIDDDGNLAILGQDKAIYVATLPGAVTKTTASISSTFNPTGNPVFFYDAGTVGEGFIFKSSSAFHQVNAGPSSATVASATTTGFAKNLVTTMPAVMRIEPAKILVFTYENGLKLIDMATNSNSSF